MLSPSLATLRLFLHVGAATIWVGGQIVMVGLLPALRRLSPDAPRIVARQFNRIAWPAFIVLFLTGGWNLGAVEVSSTSTSYQITAITHATIGTISGAAAAVHAGAKSRILIALSGGVGGLLAIIALFLGVLLRSG